MTDTSQAQLLASGSDDEPVAEQRSRLWVIVAVVATVAVVAAVQAVNMFGYPYLEDDEGTYVGQAWALLNEGRLAPYTYFYDHAPGGWMQIAAWQWLTGGANGAFGDAIASGRVLMLLLQVASTLLVIRAGRAMTGSILAGLLAALVFGLSPYGLLYHRRVLLDNIATFWMLASFNLLVAERLRLTRLWLSAATLGIAVWSKEIAVIAIPAFAVLGARQVPRHSRLMALVGWPLVCLSIVSVYPLMALLKGELFPSGSLLGGSDPHVSLLCSLAWQSGRGSDGGILNPGSAFWSVVGQWAAKDPVLVLGGTISALLAVVLLRKSPAVSMLGWLVLSVWLFLGRSGVILDFYLIPLLPFLALALSTVLWRATGWIRSRVPATRAWKAGGTGALLAVIAIAGSGAEASSPGNRGLWEGRPVTGQEQAVAWIRQHVPSGSRMIIDMYMWVDLHDPGAGKATFSHAEYYWKAADDPAVSRSVFRDDWRNVDYVVTTPQLTEDTQTDGFVMIQQALNHSRAVARFNTGLDVEVRRVDPSITSGGFTWNAPEAPTTSTAACMTGR